MAADCGGADCLNGRCVHEHTSEPGNTRSSPSDPESDATDPSPTGPDASDSGSGHGTGAGTGSSSETPGTDPSPTVPGDSSQPPPNGTASFIVPLETCRGSSADCSIEGTVCIQRLLREPGDPDSGVPVFPEDPTLGVCSRECSPLLSEEGGLISRSSQCEQIDIDGTIVDWQCQVVGVVGDDWQTARAASLCRPEVRSDDGRTGTCFACTDDANCADGRCVDLGLGGHVDRRCATRCDGEGSCGPGFTCTAAPGAPDGETVCLPVAGTCGDCVDRDGDGHGIGACAGRDCDDTNPLRFEGNTEICNGVDSNCDGQVDSGFASGASPDGDPIYASLDACGACDQPCPRGRNNTSYACESLGDTFACVPSCATGYSTCGAPLTPDPQEAPSCDFNTRNDPDSCGEDCLDCAAELGSEQVFCNQGVCQFSSCPSGQASCDPPEANLCETDITRSVQHCGLCGNDCTTLANTATTACESLNCAIVSCDTGWADCNGTTADGCETDIRTSREHCGGCGQQCAGSATCSGGSCTCAGSGETYCPPGGLGTPGCQQLATDDNNCGQCGRQCGPGRECRNGSCVCRSGLTECGGQCVNTDSSMQHCGRCNFACGQNAFCTSGTCESFCLPCPSWDPNCGCIIP
ncbi:MAG: hypothetical protein EA398_12145 [Deltaproteobacteria bacterium]|nr:MAG: hypothetical protein EA398_12145 [Deltaproteobacteria bacterium]